MLRAVDFSFHQTDPLLQTVGQVPEEHTKSRSHFLDKSCYLSRNRLACSHAEAEKTLLNPIIGSPSEIT
jgi:hypothetical protein